jgi:hypothetical protein
MEFSEWITKKYIQWRGDKIGAEGTQTAFANYLDVPQQVMSDWMKKGGSLPRKAKYVNLLAAHYPEIYELLNIPAPENQEVLSHLPPNFRFRLLQAEKEVDRVLQRRGLTGEDPQAEEITIRIFEKWGFKYVSTETIPDEIASSYSE